MSQENVERFVAMLEAFNRLGQAPDDLFAHFQEFLCGMDSKIQWRDYGDHKEALEAVGLSE